MAFAELPEDKEAYRRALRTIDAWAHVTYQLPFELLEADKQDDLLLKLSSGETLHGEGNADQIEDLSLLNTTQMRLWFQDLRADAVKAYMSHPATLGRIGYSGIADGGVAATMRGFVLIGAGETESWEPKEKLAKP